MSSQPRACTILFAVSAVIYLAVAMAVTWPLVTVASTCVSIGFEDVETVPLLNVWTIWWNADRAGAGLENYWHAPIFQPTRYAFAFSEAQPTTLIVAPIVALSGPVLAYNVYLLGVLTLNGLVTFRLLRRVGLMLLPALLGGVLVETLPIVQWQFGVLQLTTICGVVWVIDRLVALRDGRVTRTQHPRDAVPFPAQPEQPQTPPTVGDSTSSRPCSSLRLTDAVLLGIAAAVCYAACNYFGLFLSVLLPLSFLPLVFGRWLSGKFWGLLLLSVAVAALASSPILYAQFHAKSEYDWDREEDLLYRLSAQPRDYMRPHRMPLVEGPDLKDPERPLWTLGPGPFKFVLAAAGIIAGLSVRRHRRWTLFLILFGGFAFVLSLGLSWEFDDALRPELRPTAHAPIDHWQPYHALMQLHPGLALARSPFRFAFFVHLALALLSAVALDGLWTAGRTLAGGRTMWVRSGLMVVTALGCVALGGYAAVEILPTRQVFSKPPTLDRDWIRWLTKNSDPDRPILCLPFPMGAGVGDYERTAQFMIEQTGHRRAMVGGYSGFFPPSFLDLKALLTDFPDEVVINELRRRRVEFIVSADPEWTWLATRTASLRLAFHDDEAMVSIFAVEPPTF